MSILPQHIYNCYDGTHIYLTRVPILVVKLMVKNNEAGKENEAFYDAITGDVTQVLIQLLSERGHGKSSSLRTIIDYCKRKHPELVFKIIDLSQSWYHCAPVKHRQHVTVPNIRKGLIQNIGDCVYEIGSLTKEQRRAFVGSLIKQDWDYRYSLKMQNPEALKREPWIIYVFEESNIYFGSYSFRSNDLFTPVLQDFVSVGRNYRLGAFLVATAEVGEMSPSLRRRSRKIYGRVESESDLAQIRRRDRSRRVKVEPLVKQMPRFHFLYEGDKGVYGPVRIPDVVVDAPVDYVPVTVEEEGVGGGSGGWGWWFGFFASFFIVFMFLLYFLG